MIDTEQVSKIKEYQRDFEDRFGKRLEIDWNGMKGLKRRMITFRHVDEQQYVDPQQLLDECIAKYDASIDKIRDRSTRIHAAGSRKERMALEDYCKVVIESRVNVKEAAKLINRDRTVIYHFASLRQ